MPLRLSSSISRAFAAAGALALTALLAACGTASAAGANAQATATCPPTPSFTSVSGAITAVASDSITVKNASGATSTVALTATTRYSVTQSVPASSLTQGTPVLVLTDTNATTAHSIRVLSGTGTGGGGFGGGRFGGGNGMPRPGSNSACARRGFGGGFGSGSNGAGTGFQGLTGTVDSASATNLTFDDTQGQTYSLAITSTTTITKTAAGQASDLKVGENALIVASKTNGQLTARTVTIQE
jgi:hypothetical protein